MSAAICAIQIFFYSTAQEFLAQSKPKYNILGTPVVESHGDIMGPAFRTPPRTAQLLAFDATA